MCGLKEFLDLSDQLREGYTESLGKADVQWESVISNLICPIPELLREIYSHYAGTPREIKAQIFMDFIPGYRLLHIAEITDETLRLRSQLHNSLDVQFPKDTEVVPLLANYSTDYIFYVREKTGEEYLVNWLHDECAASIIYESVNTFYKTLVECYTQQAYFADNDGYLDYEMDKERVIGEKYNSNTAYWKD